MGRAVDKARGILKDLVGGTIPLSSTLDGGGRYLTAELSGDYAGLLKLVTGPKIIYDPGHRHQLYQAVKPITNAGAVPRTI